MPGVSAEITWNDGEVQQAFDRLLKRGGSLKPLFADLGEQLLASTPERFRASERRAPDGTPWAPLSDAYKERKRRNRSKILIRDGDLMQTLAYQARRNRLQVGSPRIYAGTQQFGAQQGEFGRTGRGTPIPWGDISAREFVGLSDADQATIRETTTDFLAELVRR